MLKKFLFSVSIITVCTSVLAYNREYFAEDVFDEFDLPISKVHEYDKLSDASLLENWFNGPYATEDWFGLRTVLEDRGIVAALSYLGNFAGNTTGGMSRGVAISSSVNLGVGINLGKLFDSEALSNWSIGNTWVWRFGNSLTNERVGNAFSVQQNYGNQTIRLQSLFLAYNRHIEGGWDFSFKFGRMAAGDDFITKPIYWLYMSNSIDGNPVGVYKQTKFSAYPGGTWGAVAKIKAPEGQYFKAGVYQINNEIQDSPSKHGLDFSMSNALGVNANFELGWDINHDNSGRSPGNISVGFVADWYDAVHLNDPSKFSTFNSSIYIQADYMIWNMGFPDRSAEHTIKRGDSCDSYRDLRGIVLWGALQYDPDEKLAEMPLFITGGLLFNAPFETRVDDVLCFGISYGKFSDDLLTEQRNSYELVLELNYKAQINRFFFVQPDIQYIINTNGGQYPNALVLGLQFGMSF